MEIYFGYSNTLLTNLGRGKCDHSNQSSGTPTWSPPLRKPFNIRRNRIPGRKGLDFHNVFNIFYNMAKTVLFHGSLETYGTTRNSIFHHRWIFRFSKTWDGKFKLTFYNNEPLDIWTTNYCWTLPVTYAEPACKGWYCNRCYQESNHWDWLWSQCFLILSVLAIRFRVDTRTGEIRNPGLRKTKALLSPLRGHFYNWWSLWKPPSGIDVHSFTEITIAASNLRNADWSGIRLEVNAGQQTFARLARFPAIKRAQCLFLQCYLPPQ